MSVVDDDHKITFLESTAEHDNTLWELQQAGMIEPFDVNLPHMLAVQYLDGSAVYDHKIVDPTGRWRAIGDCNIIIAIASTPQVNISPWSLFGRLAYRGWQNYLTSEPNCKLLFIAKIIEYQFTINVYASCKSVILINSLATNQSFIDGDIVEYELPTIVLDCRGGSYSNNEAFNNYWMKQTQMRIIHS